MSLVEVLHKDGFQLRNFLETLDTFFEDISDGLDDVLRESAESRNQLPIFEDQVQNVQRLWVLVFLKHASQPNLCVFYAFEVILVDLQIRAFFFWLLSLLHLFEGVVHDGSRNYLGVLRNVAEHEVDKLVHRVLAQVQHCVLHHEVDEIEELLELSELVGLLGVFLNVEPALADVSKALLDDFFKSEDPA